MVMKRSFEVQTTKLLRLQGLLMQESLTPSDKTGYTQKNSNSLLSRRSHRLKEERAHLVLKVL